MAAAKKTTYTGVRTKFQIKMNAYRTLCNQTTGGVSAHRPTPTQLSTFSKWVDKGAVIHSVTPTQLGRWSGQQQKTWTPGTVKTTLTQKFGKTYIKAVAYDKTGGFIVATSPTRGGKTFKFQ
jgi:hypothetical protein